MATWAIATRASDSVGFHAGRRNQSAPIGQSAGKKTKQNNGTANQIHRRNDTEEGAHFTRKLECNGKWTTALGQVEGEGRGWARGWVSFFFNARTRYEREQVLRLRRRRGYWRAPAALTGFFYRVSITATRRRRLETWTHGSASSTTQRRPIRVKKKG